MRNEARNKEVVRAYVEAMNAGDSDSLRRCFAPDAVIHGVVGHGSLDFAMPVWRDLHDCLAMRLDIEDIVATADTVVARFRETGRSIAPFRDRPATGKSFELVAIEWFTLGDGLITARWGVRDSASLARQLGWQS